MAALHGDDGEVVRLVLGRSPVNGAVPLDEVLQHVHLQVLERLRQGTGRPRIFPDVVHVRGWEEGSRRREEV